MVVHSLYTFNNPLASWSIKNFNFLLLYTEHFDKSIISPFLVLTKLDFYFLYFFYLSNNIALFCIYFILLFIIRFFLFLFFIFSNSFRTLFIKTNSTRLIFESIKTLEIKTYTLFNLDFANDHLLSYFLFSFLIIDLYFLNPAEINISQ